MVVMVRSISSFAIGYRSLMCDHAPAALSPL
jgi:hypothetical protein